MRKAFSGIDRTNFEHAFYALCMQFGTLALLGWINFLAALLAGTTLGIGFFVGREHAQAEKRWQCEWGQGSVWTAFNMRYWDWNSRWDLIFPTVACVLSGLILLTLYG